MFFFIFSKFFLYKFSSCFLFNVNFVLEISQDSNLHFKWSQKRLKSMICKCGHNPAPIILVFENANQHVKKPVFESGAERPLLY